MDIQNYTTEHRKGQHLLAEERHEIEVRLKDGWSPYRIAKHLGRAYNTIKNEIARGTVYLYNGKVARYKAKAGELDDGTISTLNDKLNYAVSLSDEQPEISVTYFKPDSKKNGGEYVTHTGVIKRVDEYERKLIFTDKTEIPIDDIYGIDGEIFNGLY